MSDKKDSKLSLSAKAKKFDVSLSTLKTVYKRGVAAWNSGHRPGTTPQQWGHARVNSFLRKGKTYHTADKDLREDAEQLNELNIDTYNKYIDATYSQSPAAQVRKVGQPKYAQRTLGRLRARKLKQKQIDKPEHQEKLAQIRREHEALHNPADPSGRGYGQGRYMGDHVEYDENINRLFEMQLVGTDEYRQHAIAMTPGQDQEIEYAFPNQEYDIQAAEEQNIVDESDGSVESGTSESVPMSFRAIRKRLQEEEIPEVEEEEIEDEEEELEDDGAEDGIDFTPTLKTKKVKNTGPVDYGRADSSGLPILSTNLVEAVKYHKENNISLVENIYRPGSEMFFEMLFEAKRLYAEGAYTPKDEYEQDLLESDIGEIAEYEGQPVLLDFPFEEDLEECWNGYEQKGMKKKGKKMVPNCVPVNEEGDPTKGKGIGKPFRSRGGGAVYVKNEKGNVIKVNFSQSGMKKRFNEPGRVKSFVARHNCYGNKDRTSASYWACRWPRYFSDSGQQWW